MKKIYIVNDKKSFILSLPPLTNIKVMSLNELEDKLLGTYNNEARTYLYINKHIPLNLIDIYLSTFKYLNDNDINSKIKMLNDLKKELIEKGLYFYDEIFINSLKNTSITFKDFIQNKHLDKIINLLKDKCEVNVEYMDINIKKHDIHQYKTLDDELDDVIYRIMKLLDNGVNINNIKLMNLNNEYYPSLNRILMQYKLPFVNLYDSKYDTSNYVINFIDNLNKLGVKESLKLLNNSDYDIKILNIINNYAYLDDIEIAKEFIIKDLKKISISKVYKDNYLELVDVNYKIKDDDYIFFLNFNNGSAPAIYDDSDLITDEEYDILGELNSSLKTNLLEKQLLSVLNKCYFISFKLTSLSNKHIPSYLIYKYDFKVINEMNNNHLLYDKTYYSNDIEKFNYALSKDHYFKTKEKSEKYECLSYNFKNSIDQKHYDFTGIDPLKLKESLDGKFTLSYSSLNTYYKCKFQYYLNSILNLNKFENTLATIRGNVYHKLLEECEKEDFNYDDVFEKEISSFKETDNKIRFFSSLIKEEFYMVKEFNRELKESTMLNDILHEYKIEFHEYIDDYDITIKGFIDKIMYDDDHIALLDFKSGSSAKFKLDNLYYGLDLQLPMYAYFISKDEELSKKQISGLYLQYIYKHFNNRDIKNVDECNKKYRLDGYTNDSLQDVVTNDTKKFIMKKNNNFSSLILNNIAPYTEQKVKEAIKGIISGDFEIDPHTIETKNDSCDYCQFKDICYFKGKKKDYKNISPNVFLSNMSIRDVLLSCFDFIEDNNEIKEEVNKILNGDDASINDKLIDILDGFAPLNDNIANLLNYVYKRKESENNGI